jgi:phage/plasmid-like protein (TIGR03299 family)
MTQLTRTGECHQLDTTRGSTSMMSTKGIVPWHGLGTVLEEEAVDSATAIKAAGLDWSLYKNEMSTIDADGKPIEVPDKFAIVRGDTSAVLGVVGKNYKIFENQEAFKFFDEVIGEKLAIYETAGSLKEGRIVWILASLPNTVRISNTDDVSNPYVLLSTSHDGSTSVIMTPTLVRVVCANTYTAAMSQFSIESGIKIRHTKNMNTKKSIAKDRLNIVSKQIDTYNEQANILGSNKISSAQLANYVTALFPDNPEAKSNVRTQNMRDSIVENFELSEVPSTDGTWWKALNAVTEFVDHSRSTKGISTLTRQENRMQSVLMGSGALLKRKAMDKALELVG